MTVSMSRPAPEQVAERAQEIYATLMADPEIGRLEKAVSQYSSDWDDFYGYPIIVEYNAVTDAPGLFKEAIRAMAIKSAVWDLTGGDERTAELPLPVPVDTMTHAMMAQFSLLTRMMGRHGIQFVHMTDMEHGNSAWDHGDYTHQVYKTAFGDLNPRYWIGAEETERRRLVLDTLYAGIGVTERGKRVSIPLATTAA
ncbi:hypothetical protein ACFU6R_25475 [Streptomyces sp. NPDC057499]|uniref:hypothetical protein n=1 Tax=Streptomyces sp. NPDC057499 TaxID=3346150 RepID=UPI003681828B